MALGDYGAIATKNGKVIIGEEDARGMFRINPLSTLGF